MDPEPQVLKEVTCPSLSTTSDITYEIGTTPDGTIHIRIIGNSGTGNFNGYWVSMPKIRSVLNDQDGPFIWSALCPLFEGRSVNSACFLMAVLLAEKIVQPSKERPRRYEMADPEPFMAKVQALLAPKEKPRPPKEGAKKPPTDDLSAEPAVIDPPADPAMSIVETT